MLWSILLAILKNLASILFLVIVPYTIFCLWRMFDGDCILVPRTKPAGKLNFRPFNVYQHEALGEVFRIWQWRSIRDEAHETLRRLPDPRRDLRGFLASMPNAKNDLKSVFKIFWEWAWPFAVGLIVGLVNLVSSNLSKSLWLAPVNLVILLVITAGLIFWWFRDGSNLRELLMFSVIMVIMSSAIGITADVARRLWQNTVWTSFLSLLPLLVLIGGIGACAINLLYSFAVYKEYSVLRKLSYVSTAVLSVLLVVLLICNIK